MKKMLAIILVLGLLCGIAAPGGTEAEESLADFVCEVGSFSVKIPSEAVAVYEENSGLVIYPLKQGYIPYVIVARRPVDMKFNNPTNYLNNVYREFVENRFGDDSLGMSPARSWEMGGKQLLGAQYRYRIGATVVTHLQLIEIRNGGDVEYTAKFYEGYEDITMAALDAAVRYYQETDSPAVPEEEPTAKPAPAGNAAKVIKPLDLSGMKPDTGSGTYHARLTDTDRIANGGFFTVELYQQDQYLLSEINALLPGDQVQVNGKQWTVASLKETEDGQCEMYVREETYSYFVFQKDTDTTCTILVDDWSPCTLIGSEKIMLPLPYAFAFVWSGGDDAQIYDADAFIKLIQDGETVAEMNPYNTAVSFSGGLLTIVSHSDYPPGPDEAWNEAPPSDAPTATPQVEPATGSGTSAPPAAVPAFLTPSEFVGRFNAAMAGLLDGYTNVLGESVTTVLKEQYALSLTDPQGMIRYYGTQDWSLEAGFFFTSESGAQDTEPASVVNFAIKKTAPELIRSLAVYSFQMMIAYEFQDTIAADALSDWFSTAQDPANVFQLPGYTLNVLVSDEYTQYAVLPAEMPVSQP